jgi:hypothetical protein
VDYYNSEHVCVAHARSEEHAAEDEKAISAAMRGARRHMAREIRERLQSMGWTFGSFDEDRAQEDVDRVLATYEHE